MKNSDLKPVKTKEPAKFVKERKELVGRLLVNCPKICWIIELGISKRLFSYYPYPEFWAQFELPPFLKDIDSIRVLAGKWGLEFIKKQFNAFSFAQESKKQIELQNQVKLTDSKIGEDIKFFVKKKSLLNFLK